MLTTAEHLSQWAREAYRYWQGEPTPSLPEQSSQQPAEDPPVQVIHPDRVYWTERGGRVHLTRNCPTLANSRPEAMLFRPVCQVCGDWRVWTQDPPVPSQAAAPTQSARRGRSRPERAPPQEDAGLQFILQSEDVVPPTSPERVDPPEEEPEPSLTSEMLDASIESWPGSSSGGAETPEPTEDGQAG